ncbi:S53 family peptidase [Kitasatospora sp. NBC_01287]|uniref:S53 family peptidase n=1 Tax=Kitasatospora sp. NBC_01287 TaxID=2903573 RepID=UPI00225C222D|nr:S53 family peptidase [Kitasatospora sp. NBC_01287]MCX4744579.1 S53 family peptidase [Kitasatospora sp. NBC_01287]
MERETLAQQQQSATPTARRPGAGTMAGAAALAAATLVAAGAVAPVAGAATPTRTALPSAVPSWTASSQPPADTGAAPGSWTLSLRVYLAGQDPMGLAEAARSVSDPSGRDYAHYLTPTQFEQRYGTTAAQTAKVSSWLSGLGMHVTGSNAHYLTVTGTVAEAQQAFATTLHSYAWSWGVGYAPVSGISVPAALGHDITTVIGLDNPSANEPTDPAPPAAPTGTTPTATPRGTAAKPTAPTPAAARAAAPTPAAGSSGGAVPQPCSQWWGESSSPIPAVNGRTTAIDQVCGYTPQQMRDAYGVTNSPYTGRGRTVAVVLDGALPTMEADADTFFAAHGVPGFAPGQYSENFGPNFAASCRTSAQATEESLDVETIHIAAPDAKVVYVGADCTSDEGYGGGSLAYLDATTRIVDQHLADVATDSYSTDERTSTPTTMAAWDQMFQQGTLEGIGFDYASGDFGDGLDGEPAGTPGMVVFPAADQWATSVGGTTLEIGRSGKVAGELAWGSDAVQLDPQGTGYLTPPPGTFQMGSTGGRSSLISEPWYQKGKVPSALATAGGTAPAHRVQPDLSADADPASGWLVGYTPLGGAYQEVMGGGTSGSSPLIAGLEADAAQAAGHALGFANPLLYSMGGTPAIHDVLPAPAGQAPWVRTYQADWEHPGAFLTFLSLEDQDTSLKAAPGYDDATGLGSATASFVRTFARH